MALSRRQNDTPRPSRGPVHSGATKNLSLGRPIVALLREIRRRGWSALLERLAPAWSWDVAAGGRRRTSRPPFHPTIDGRLEARMLLTYWHVVPKVLGNAALLAQASQRQARPSSRTCRRRSQHANPQVPGQRHHAEACRDRDPDGPRRPGRRGHGARRLALHDQAVVHLQHDRDQHRRGDRTARRATRARRPPPRWCPSRTPTIPSRSARSGRTPCRAAAWASSSTARRPNTDLTINPLGQPQKKGFAKSFAYGESARNHLLNIGQLTVTSGQIGAIEGFQDAELSGPLTVPGTASIDRIALDAILPGASITTGGDISDARRAQQHRPERARHRHHHRPRPQPAQRRHRHHPVQRGQLHHQPQPRAARPAAQGDRHGLERPVAQLHERLQ